jgi:hypothetical protein
MALWTKIVTEPLGLAGFALFLIFAYPGKVKKEDNRRWLSPVASACAVVALIGGLALAYIQLSKPRSHTPVDQNLNPSQQQTDRVQQNSSGPGSPNVQGVQGDVTVTVDQSSGNMEQKRAPKRKP